MSHMTFVQALSARKAATAHKVAVDLHQELLDEYAKEPPMGKEEEDRRMNLDLGRMARQSPQLVQEYLKKRIAEKKAQKEDEKKQQK